MHRAMVKKQLETLNPNTDIPVPKTIMIRKAAVDLACYDDARELARVNNQ